MGRKGWAGPGAKARERLGLRSAGPSTVPAGPAAAGKFSSAEELSSLVESRQVDADLLQGETGEGKPEEGPSHAGSHPSLPWCSCGTSHLQSV